MSLRPFQGPLAVAKWGIFVWVVRAFHHISTARHVKLAIRGAVQLVGVVATIVLLVASEGAVDAVSV